jgi:hypothetical protein
MEQISLWIEQNIYYDNRLEGMQASVLVSGLDKGKENL